MNTAKMTTIKKTQRRHTMYSLIKKTSQWILGAMIVAFAFAGQTQAATSQNIDIKVSISGDKSVLIVGATTYDFGALAVAGSSVSASAITVRNDSTVFVQTYIVTGAHAISDTSGTDWTLDTTPAADTYALAAQFGTARPDDLDGDWTSDDLSTAPSTCSATVHGNGTEAQGGSNVGLSADRSLWFRLKTPTSVTSADGHTITVTVSVL